MTKTYRTEISKTKLSVLHTGPVTRTMFEELTKNLRKFKLLVTGFLFPYSGSSSFMMFHRRGHGQTLFFSSSFYTTKGTLIH